MLRHPTGRPALAALAARAVATACLVGLTVSASSGSVSCGDDCDDTASPVNNSDGGVIQAGLQGNGVFHINLEKTRAPHRLTLQVMSIDFGGDSSAADTVQPASVRPSEDVVSNWILRLDRSPPITWNISSVGPRPPPTSNIIPSYGVPYSSSSYGWVSPWGVYPQWSVPPWWVSSWRQDASIPRFPSHGAVLNKNKREPATQWPQQSAQYSAPGSGSSGSWRGPALPYSPYMSNVWAYPLRILALPETPWIYSPPMFSPWDPSKVAPSPWGSSQQRYSQFSPPVVSSTGPDLPNHEHSTEPSEAFDSAAGDEAETETAIETSTVPFKNIKPKECNPCTRLPPYDYITIPGLNSAYKVYEEPRIWVDASRVCRNVGAYLAVPDSREEAAELWRLWRNEVSPFYSTNDKLNVGLDDLNVEGEWRTALGNPVSESNYNEWTNGQPDGGDDENCGVLLEDQTFDDAPCNVPLPFICEFCEELE